MQICIVQPGLNTVSETFIKAHAERLPADVSVIHSASLNGNGKVLSIGDQPVLKQSLPHRAGRKAWRKLRGRDWGWETTSAYLSAFNRTGATAVLAEYGPTGVKVREACRLANLPLIVHFHGYDASRRAILKQYEDEYRELFEQAAGVVAVSRAMQQKLLSLGAPAENVHYNPYGIDCDRFGGADPEKSGPTFLAVGRFVEKKAPHLTLLAFAKAHQESPDIRLRMIGDGPLLGACQGLAGGLGVADAVTFLGSQPHNIVEEEMRTARAFVQHSVEASDGDCEGTPVAVLEAGASGLPVISTRHAGIPDVVIEGETGLLVEERDVDGMATQMVRLAQDSQFAASLGQAARKRIESFFSMERSINRLWLIIESCIEGRTPQLDDGRSLSSPSPI